MTPQFNVNSCYQISEFHMTIQLDKFADIYYSSGQPFRTGLAFKNLVPFSAITKIMRKAKEIKTPARFPSLAVQIYQLRLFRM